MKTQRWIRSIFRSKPKASVHSEPKVPIRLHSDSIRRICEFMNGKSAEKFRLVGKQFDSAISKSRHLMPITKLGHVHYSIVSCSR